MATSIENLSSDLIWEVTRNQNAFLVKRKQSGGIQLSRDPLNLVNKHSRKYAGYANEKAIGIHADDNTISFVTKVASKTNKPASVHHKTSFAASTPSRKVYRNVVSSTAKKGYRADLRAEAVARASAIKRSQRDVKDTKRVTKLRGAKAKKAAAESS
ncbi:Hypothetical protein R9X50_00367000 [Acrodontium crateriforme]|uniref:Ribosomal eL28/Mak16 domain-containing protein n=1 Tax=Acrodontium crateriforme TaxID=150365 RepID=A0AAQ3RA27_9PEZI|nr:Hypothetical protein R9X50_00367000 [Acrodontium crateriforme]